ncbi:LTO1 [Auxenochlorella protothecoides x Auxenochlorella symbiontica]
MLPTQGWRSATPPLGVPTLGAPRCRSAAHARHVRGRSSNNGSIDETGDEIPLSVPQPEPSRRQVPCRLIAGLATAGCLETAYLTIARYTNAPVACPIGGGCATVLTSEWSTLFHTIPLSLAGSLSYGAVAGLALWQLTRRASPTAPDPRSTKLIFLGGALALSTTSAYLLYILLTRFPGESCSWCLASAGLSFGIAAAAASALRAEDLAEAAGAAGGIVAFTSLALAVGIGRPNASVITALDYHAPEITTESSQEAMSLAERLRAAGARMYGAFWCSHCYEQKLEFGREAMAAFPYVECYPTGWHPGMEPDAACTAVPGGLEGFPTWVIGGKKSEGDLTLQQLEERLSALGY